MRQVVGGRAVDAQAASASQMGRFETETLALAGNRAALADLNGQWIDRFHDRNGLKYIVLDMDSSVSPTHGDQEGSAWNGHFDCSCYHPNFLFNQFGMLERCALRHGNVHSADGWRDVLDPVIARYAERDLGGRFFRADAAYAIPAGDLPPAGPSFITRVCGFGFDSLRFRFGQARRARSRRFAQALGALAAASGFRVTSAA